MNNWNSATNQIVEQNLVSHSKDSLNHYCKNQSINQKKKKNWLHVKSIFIDTRVFRLLLHRSLVSLFMWNTHHSTLCFVTALHQYQKEAELSRGEANRGTWYHEVPRGGVKEDPYQIYGSSMDLWRRIYGSKLIGDSRLRNGSQSRSLHTRSSQRRSSQTWWTETQLWSKWCKERNPAHGNMETRGNDLWQAAVWLGNLTGDIMGTCSVFIQTKRNALQ